MNESVLRFRVETKDANAKINRLKQQVQKLEVAVKGAGGSTKVAGAGFKAFSGGAQAAAVGARGLGAALSTALGPLTAVVAAAASLGQVFNVLRQQDFAEAKVRSLGVNSNELTARLKDVSTELSGQASVLDLTGAAYDVASAGFNNAADAALILKAASQGATGGFSDINTVGDATTSVLNAYGLEADKAAKLVDGFIQTQNDGKIVIGEYAANIAKVAPVAAALGVPLEEVNAAVAQITAGGQGAEVTFTALKTAFAQVAAGKVGNEFKALGIEINASTLKSDGLAGTLEKIKKSGADAGTVIKAFGTEAGPSILALLNDTEKYNQLLKNQKEAQGAAAKAAFTASDTIDGQLKRLTTAFQNLFSDQSELGVLIKETFKVAAVTVEVLVAAINLLLAPIRAIFAGVNEIGKAISQALGVDGTDAAFKLEQGFQSIMKAVRIVQNFIIGFGIKVGKKIGQVYAGMINGGKGVAQGLVGVFTGLFSKITQIIGNAYNALPPPIKNFIEGKIKRVKNFVTSAVNLGAGFAPGAGASAGLGPQDLGGAAANAIAGTGGALSKQKAEEQNREIERLAKIAKQHAKTVQSLEDRKLLASALTKEEKKQFTRQIQMATILRENKDLNAEQLKVLIDKTLELNEQLDTSEELKKADKDRADAAKKLQDAEKKRAEELKGVYQSIADTIADGFVDAIEGAVKGTKTLAEVATGILDDLASQFLQLARNQLFFGNITGSLSKGSGLFGNLFGGFLADGGPATAGRSYVVGERGPEIFTPGRSGTVTSNDALGGASVTVNVDASGSNVEGDAEQSKQLGKAIGLAVQQELIKQQRPGGLLG